MLINVDSIYEIKDTPQVGYLYIFDASHYDNDLTICLNDTVKIGMTAGNIKTRLNQYKSIPKNISFIQCSEPSKREKLLKSYIKENLNIKPTYGYEYFNGCRKELEQVILYFASCKLDIINRYYDYKKEKQSWFDSIEIKTIKENKECVWCNERVENIKFYLKNCRVDKDIIYQQIIEEKDIEIASLKEQIESYKNKLYLLNTKSILNCDKPLILDIDYIQKQLVDYCTPYYLKRGGEGMCDWFLEYVCTNKEGNICIECIDKVKNRFKFEDKYGNIKEILGKDIVQLIMTCFTVFFKTENYLTFLKEVEENTFNNKYNHVYEVIHMKPKFVNRLVSRTHKDSFKSLLKTNKDKEEIT